MKRSVNTQRATSALKTVLVECLNPDESFVKETAMYSAIVAALADHIEKKSSQAVIPRRELRAISFWKFASKVKRDTRTWRRTKTHSQSR